MPSLQSANVCVYNKKACFNDIYNADFTPRADLKNSFLFYYYFLSFAHTGRWGY